MAISDKKRRYSVTLTPAHVERFQNLCQRLGLPLSTLSNVLDDSIVEITQTFQIALDKGTTGIINLLKEKQQEFDLQINEGKKEKKNVSQKRQEKNDTRKKSSKSV